MINKLRALLTSPATAPALDYVLATAAVGVALAAVHKVLGRRAQQLAEAEAVLAATGAKVDELSAVLAQRIALLEHLDSMERDGMQGAEALDPDAPVPYTPVPDISARP